MTVAEERPPTLPEPATDWRRERFEIVSRLEVEMLRPVPEYRWPTERRRLVEAHDAAYLTSTSRAAKVDRKPPRQRAPIVGTDENGLPPAALPMPASLARKSHAERVATQKRSRPEKVAPFRPLPKRESSGMPFIQTPVDRDAAIARAAEAM